MVMAASATAVLFLSRLSMMMFLSCRSCCQQQQQQRFVRSRVSQYYFYYRHGACSSSLSSSSSLSFSSLSSSRHDNVITSTQSNTVKLMSKLMQQRKTRYEWQQTIVEGPKIIRELLHDPTTRHLVQQIIISTDRWDDYYGTVASVASLGGGTGEEEDDSLSKQPRISVVAARPNILDTLSDTVTHQGIMARVSIPNPATTTTTTTTTTSIQQQQQQQPPYPLYLVMDGISDPGNLGTLIRSSVAVGVAAVVLLPHTVDPWSPKALRAAMGTTFRIPIVTQPSWSECQTWLLTQQQHPQHQPCHRIYAATMLEDDELEGVVGSNNSNDDNSLQQQQPSSRKSHAYFDIDWLSEPIALVVGSEGSGLSGPVKHDVVTTGRVQAVHVPMAANVESLNAAVCGSVILFEHLRQKQQHRN